MAINAINASALAEGYSLRPTVRAKVLVTDKLQKRLAVQESVKVKKRPKFEDVSMIMFAMKKVQHIDPDLFDLFLSSGACRECAERFLRPEQIDSVEVDRQAWARYS